MQSLTDMLSTLAQHNGSDLYLSTGAPPCAKFQGQLKPISKENLAPGQVKTLVYQLLTEEQQHEFEHELELNSAISLNNIGRFRLNVFMQRNDVSVVARNIHTDIPNFDSLGLPVILKKLILRKNGLILFVGGTGSGKSTSLAALIDYRNSHASGHIITIEDPVEFIHRHKKSIVNQREVGMDTHSFAKALKNTLRQAPDVILIGEIRDRDTMEHALAFAETGHLAISTLHANNANQALDRIINFFPEERRAQLFNDLGNNLVAFISQRLIPSLDGKRKAAIEVLLGTPTIKEQIQKGVFSNIKEIMAKSEAIGMQTFDRALFDLVETQLISEEEALKHADSANNLRLRLKLKQGDGAESVKKMHLSIQQHADDKDERPNS